MKRLTLILVLMLSIVFFVGCIWIIPENSDLTKENLTSSLRTFALAISVDVSNLEHEDSMSDPDPGDVEIGDTFTGPSGTTYELQEENLAPGEEEYYNSWGLDCSGVWVVLDGKRM